MSALYYSFGKRLKTLLITNDSDWFNQSKEEFKEYVVEKAKTSGELTDEQLEAVAGGGVWDVVKSIIMLPIITLSFDAGCV